MYYVSVQLNEGLGNRFFQIAALLGYAEKHGHTPILLQSWIKENKTHPGPKSVLDFFPDLHVVDDAPDGTWITYSERGEDCFSYVEIPRYDSHVKLVGCFQSEKYFPSVFPFPAILQSCVSNIDSSGCAFLHVRRGDYLNPYCAHHCVDLRAYYRRALTCVGDGPVLVCSDDIPWCKSTLPALYSDLVSAHHWIFLEGVSDYETLALMIRCGRGAICANSTFSWWGAYWGAAVDKFMPARWGHTPLPSARDLYPAGVIMLPV